MINFYRDFQKRKYLKEIHFTKSKSIIIKYHKKSDLKLSFLLNPDNVFFDSKGYQCVITTENSAENINPLDFNSKYPAERFKTAIETKLINDTFTSLKKKGLDLGMITLIGIGIVIVLLIYMIMGTV